MMNNLEIVLDIWKRLYDTDFALLDTPQEQIEFLKDLLLKNKENVIEAEKLPQFMPSDSQLSDQIKDEFAPHKPTDKEWKKRWDEVSVHKIGIQRLLLMVGSTEIIGDL